MQSPKYKSRKKDLYITELWIRQSSRDKNTSTQIPAYASFSRILRCDSPKSFQAPRFSFSARIFRRSSLPQLRIFVQNCVKPPADSCCVSLCARAPGPSPSAQIILSMDLQQARRSIFPASCLLELRKPKILMYFSY